MPTHNCVQIAYELQYELYNNNVIYNVSHQYFMAAIVAHSRSKLIALVKIWVFQPFFFCKM